MDAKVARTDHFASFAYFSLNDSLCMESPTPSVEEVALAKGLAAVIDRALERHPPHETFVYGIHQELAPGVAESLREHYVAAGWTGVSLREGASGAYLLVLRP